MFIVVGGFIMDGKRSIEESSYFGLDKDGNYVNVPTMEDCLRAIETRYQRSLDTNERLREEIKKLENEHYENEEIQRLTKKLESMQGDLYRGFGITEEDEERIDAWKKEHEEEKHGLKTLKQKLAAGGAIGGRYSYIFLPTSIGVVGRCKCNACGEEFEFCSL